MTARRFKRQKEKEQKKLARKAAARKAVAVTTALVAGAAAAHAADYSIATTGGTSKPIWGDNPTITLRSTTGTGLSVGTSTTSATNDTLSIFAGGGTNVVLGWDKLNILSGKILSFEGPNSIYLNKVTGTSPSSLAGSLQGNTSATVLIVNPNGITVGAGASVGIKNLLLSTAPTSAYSDDASTLQSSVHDSSYNATPSEGTISIQQPLTIGTGLRLQGNMIDIQAPVQGTKGLTIEGTTSVNAGSNALSADNTSTLTITSPSISATGLLTGNEIVIGGGSGAVNLSTSANQLDVTATGGITIANDKAVAVKNLNAGSGDVVLTASGDVTNGVGGGAQVVTANNLTVKTSGQVGASGNSLGFDANTITITNTDGASATAKAVFLDSKGGGTLTLKDVKAGTGDVTLAAAGAVDQGAGKSITANTLSVTAAGDVTLANAGNQVANLGDVNAAGHAFAITDSTSLTETGNVAAASVAIDAGANSFALTTGKGINAGAGTIVITADTIDLASGGANNGAVVAGTTTLQQSTAGRAIKIGGTGGTGVNLSDNSVAAVAGDIVIGKSGGSAGAVTIDTATFGGNATINASTVTGVGGTDITGSGVTINSANAGAAVNLGTDISSLTVTGANNGGVTVNNAGALNIGGIGTGGNLDVTAGGAITQTGAVTVTGTTALAAGAGNDITLAGANDFGGAVSVASGKDVRLNDVNAVALGASTVSGNLNVTANGAITQTGALSVTGSTAVAAGAANDITLGAANVLGGTVTVASGKDVAINNTGAVDLGASTVSGNLSVTANGAITDSGAVAVGGNTALAAGAGNDITLDDADTFTGSVGITSGKNVALNSTGALDLAASTVSGNLDVTANGAITDSGALAVTGGTTLAAGAGNDITLDNADHFTGGIGIASGKDVTLTDTGALDLHASTVSGNLGVTANGAITDSGALAVSGTTTMTAGAGNDITLDAGDHFAGGIGIGSGNNVAITDTGALDLRASTVSGTLDVTASGAITDSGALAIAGAATLAAGAGNDITLDDANLFAGGVGVTSGKNVTLNDTGALDLAASTVSGNLSVTANGAITDSGAIAVTGATTMAAGAANNITLDAGDHFAGGIGITSGNDVTVADTGALALGASTVSGNLSATAHGDITETGALAVTGTSTFTVDTATGKDVKLDTQANDFAGGVTIATANGGSTRDIGLRNVNAGATLAGVPTTGRNLTVTFDNAAVNLPVTTLTGNLSVTAGGAITDSGAVSVGGTTTLAAGSGNDIVLNNADHFAGGVSVTSGNNVTLNDTGALDLGASTVSGNLSVTANGAITDSGAVAVTGTTTLAAGAGNNITLDAGDHFAGGIGITSGNNVAITDTGAVDLRASTVSGTLDVTANGAITDSGALTVTGSTTLAAGAGNNITLDNADHFAGGVGIASGNDVAITDTGALDLHASTVSGNLSVTANGAITDSGVVAVTGSATLAAGAGNNITLDAGDHFAGGIGIASGNNVAITDTGALNLAASTVSGTLNVTAGGAITDSGALTVTGATTLAAGTGNDITLDNADHFTGGVGITSGKNVTLNDTGALDLRASTVSGNLDVTTGGAITDSGAIAVAGTTTVAAGAGNNITLDAGDHFTGGIGITSGNNVAVADTGALDLRTSTVSGNLNATAQGDITESGALAVSGTSTFTVDTATGKDVKLDTQANDFAGGVTIATANGGTTRDIGLRNVNAGATLAGVPTTGRNLTVTFDNAAVNLPVTTLTGNLSVTAGGAITDSGAVSVGGTTTLAAGAGNDIVLNNADHFAGGVSVTSGNNVTLNDTAALDLGASTVSGTLNVTANGAITDSGPVAVTGATTLAAGAGNNITLDAGDHFAGGIGITSGNSVAITDTGAVDLRASTVSGALNVTANGAITDSGVVAVTGATTLAAGTGNNITLDNADHFAGGVGIASGNNVALNDTGALDLHGSTISGNLSVTANGAITDSGVIAVTGATTLAAGAGNNITLDNAGDHFAGGIGIVSGNNVAITDTGAVDLRASTVSGTLNVTANGAITDSGALNVTGATTLAAGAGNDITLDNADHFAGGVGITSGNNVAITDTGALDLRASTVTGNLDVTAGGAITDSGALNVAGATTLAAGTGNNITLDAGDDFAGGIGITSGNDVTIADTGALDLRASTVSGNLAATAQGDITQSGALAVSGTSTFTIDTATLKDVTLDTQANDLAGAVTVATANGGTVRDIGLRNVNAAAALAALPATARNLSVTFDNAAVNLPAATLSGNLTVTAGGAITDSGAVSVTGTTTLDAGTGNNIVLNNADHFAGGVSISSAQDVTLNDTGALDLGASTVSGNLSVTANGAITDSGALNVTGTATVAAGANNITLDAGDHFAGGIGVASGNNVAITDTGALDLRASTVSGNLSVTADGAITDSGALNVTGTTTLAAGTTNNITLDNADHFAGGVGIASGNDVALNDTGALDLRASTVSGNLNLTANGNITDSGPIAVTGATTLAAGVNNITLDAGDHFAGGIGIVSGNNVAITDTGALDLAASTVSGTLNVTANGPITDSGVLAVTGATTLAAGAGNDITLDDNDHFAGGIGITSGNNVSVNDTGALDLRASTVSGDLNVTAGGPVTDSGAIAVTGATTVAAGTGNNITLDSGDHFAGGIGIVSGNDVAITDTGALDLRASTVTGDLNVTAGGAITDSGALSVTGATTASAGAGNDITLDEANDFAGGIGIGSGRNVSVNDIGALDLQASSVSGDLSVTAGGAITDSGALAVTGTTTLAAGSGNNITLDNADHFGGAVTIASAKDVTLNDTGSITMGASTVSGALNVTAGGNIAQSGGTSISAGATTLDTSGANGNIVLTGANNQFGTIDATAGSGNVSITENATMDVASISNTGNVSLNAGANDLNVTGTVGTGSTGTVSLSTSGAHDITLGSASAISGLNVSVTSGKDISALGSITADAGTGQITLAANAATGTIYGSNDVSKVLDAHGIDLTAHKIGDTGARVETNLNTTTPNNSMVVALHLGNIDSNSGVALSNNGPATLEFQSEETDTVSATQNNLELDFVRNQSIPRVSATIGNALDLVPGNFNDPAIFPLTLSSLNSRITNLEDEIGTGFGPGHTVADYLSQVINGSAGVQGLGAAHGAGITSADFFAGENSIYGLTTNLAKVADTSGGVAVLNPTLTNTDAESVNTLLASAGTTGSIRKAIADEATARDTAIASAVATEVTDRDAAIAAAVGDEATARAAAITDEATARNSAITAAIGTEVTNRNAAIATAVGDEATARAAAITDEATARNSAITAAIGTEVTNRNAAIATAVGDEATARAAADTSAQAYTDSRIGDSTVDGSTGNTLTDRINTAKANAISAAAADATTKANAAQASAITAAAADATTKANAAEANAIATAAADATAKANAAQAGAIAAAAADATTKANAAEANAIATAAADATTKANAAQASAIAAAAADATTKANAAQANAIATAAADATTKANAAQANAIAAAAADATTKANAAQANAIATAAGNTGAVLGLSNGQPIFTAQNTVNDKLNQIESTLTQVQNNQGIKGFFQGLLSFFSGK